MKTLKNVEHTPGPWELFEPSAEETTQLIGNGTIHIADIYMTDFPAGAADARLIAAAPELLAALEALVDSDYKGLESRNKAETAIRKARGE